MTKGVLGAVVALLVFALAQGLCGCTTVATSVLRHQTGESLGVGKFRGFGYFETARLATPGTTEATYLIDQNKDVFQGMMLGMQGEVGVMQSLDLMLGTNFSADGGGWKVGAKYQFLKMGNLAGAGMLSYGARSAKGNVTYLTADQPVELATTLSAYTFDFSAPVSYRISPAFAAYSGLMLLRTSVSGSLGPDVVSMTNYDLGFNLGCKINAGRFEGTIEFAFLRVGDPFMDSTRIVPYAGLSFGVAF